MVNNLFKLDEETKNCIMETSALGGFSQALVKEVFEYLFFTWAVKISEHPDEYADLQIPYLGSISLKYVDDEILPDGKLGTKVDAFITLKDSFKQTIGQLHDEGYTALIPLMSKKIEQAILVASSDEQ